MSSQYTESLRTAYDMQADRRDHGDIDDWKVVERGNFLSLLRRGGKRSLLEIGSGPGRDGKFFHDAGLQVTCIDMSPEMVRLCRQKNLNALVMDVTELAFPDSSFDAVYALNSLLHLTKAELPSVLKEIKRVLAPGGIFFMGVYGGRDFEGAQEEDSDVPKRFFLIFRRRPHKKGCVRHIRGAVVPHRCPSRRTQPSNADLKLSRRLTTPACRHRHPGLSTRGRIACLRPSRLSRLLVISM